MKKIFKKSNIFSFLLGAILFSGITAVSAYTIFANDIGYTPMDNTWKKSNGENITNVKDAVDDLYLKSLAKDSITSDNLLIEQSNIIDDTVSKTYTAEKNEVIVVSLSQTGYISYSNDIQTTGIILKDTNNLNKFAYGGEVRHNWYTQIRTIVIKLKKDDTVTLNSRGVGYGSGQYSITYIE